MDWKEFEDKMREKFGEYLFNKYDLGDLLTGKYLEMESN